VGFAESLTDSLARMSPWSTRACPGVVPRMV
jgi:hypothetical protein